MIRTWPVAPGESAAWLGGQLATGLTALSDDLADVESGGRWAVCVDFEGRATLGCFTDWQPWDAPDLPRNWRGPDPATWDTSLDSDAYQRAVADIREAIAAGDVYQANLCRVMAAPAAPDADPFALAGLLAAGNPAPHAGAMRLPAVGGSPPRLVASASPELFLSRHGDTLLSRPIKGTAATPGGFLDKDIAENIMIVDLVRNDLSAVAATGTVNVPEFLAEEKHPGLVHLVSGVAARLRDGATWADIFAATFPPGSVTGAPKSSALRIIDHLEPVPRGPYCGAFGWIDADTGEAELAVAIRTFWIEPTTTRDAATAACSAHIGGGSASPQDVAAPALLKFGTGAGITWGSDPALEWRETELKAARLVALASHAQSEVLAWPDRLAKDTPS